MITVDDSTFAAILEQVRTKEFNKELEHRMAELKEQFETREEAVRTAAGRDFEKMLSKRDDKVNELQNELTRLHGIIDGFEATKKSVSTQPAFLIRPNNP